MEMLIDWTWVATWKYRQIGYGSQRKMLIDWTWVETWKYRQIGYGNATKNNAVGIRQW